MQIGERVQQAIWGTVFDYFLENLSNIISVKYVRFTVSRF